MTVCPIPLSIPLLHVLGVGPGRDDGAGLAVDDLGDDDAGVGEGAADAVGGADDLDLVALAGGRQVAHVDVDRYARLLAQVPGRDSHAAGPVHDRRRHRPVDAAPRVDVVPRQRQPRRHAAPRRRSDPHPRQQEAVDGRVGQCGRHQPLDVRPYRLIIFSPRRRRHRVIPPTNSLLNMPGDSNSEQIGTLYKLAIGGGMAVLVKAIDK